MKATLFHLEAIRYRRSFSLVKLIPIALLLFYCVGLVQLLIVMGNFSIADFGVLSLILYLSLADILVKLFLQKRILSYPPYINTAPISQLNRDLYEIRTAINSFWNYYAIIIFLPILILINSASVVCGSVVLILATSYTNCFALRIWDKTQSVAVRIALFLLPAYYAALLLLQDFSINIWAVCGAQLLIAIAFVYISLRIKTYEEERNKKSRVIDLSWSKYSIDFLPFVRSRRLRIQLIPILYILVMLYTQRMMFDLWLFLYVLAGTALITQWHFAIEANYWNFLRTQPNGVKMIFYRKFKLIFWLQMIVMPTCIPLIFLHDDISLTSIIAINFFSATFVNMIQFMLFMIAKRFDLWGSTLFNYQGSNMTAFFVYIPLIAILCFLFQFFEHSGNYTAEYIIFFGLGILCLIFKEKIFNVFYSIYRKNRYQIADRLSY
ncbi:MAG: DUF5687 family protein [Marinilabiliaceae bacterium]|nr:DUF5687 family protein [Marinilabiliaceae bacterium]